MSRRPAQVERLRKAESAFRVTMLRAASGERSPAEVSRASAVVQAARRNSSPDEIEEAAIAE